MRFLFLGALISAVVATPAIAGDKPSEDKLVCKRTERNYTGSHLSRPKKTCMKASEWKLLEDETGRTLRKVQDANGVDPNAPRPMGSGGPG